MNEDRVLVLAPYGRDAALIEKMLGQEKLRCHVCQSVDETAAGIGEGAAMALFAEEALVGLSLERLVLALNGQPPWSDFPIILLTRGGSEASATGVRLLEILGGRANVTLLERPVRVATLLSSVRAALRARRRQYEVRDYLEERRVSHEKMLRTQKLESLGVLAGGVAHDFNNLLTGILGNASLAADALPENSAFLKPVLDDIVNASERAADLTKQLLAYAGKGRFVIQPVDLSELVRETSHLVQSTLPKHVRLQLELDDRLPPIEADASQIQQVVMNLVINAAEAIPDETTGDVRVRTGVRRFDGNGQPSSFQAGEVHEGGDYVLLEVRDTGSGMDEETRARIFDPFFTTKFTGRGLGLAAVQGIVQGHRGALKVISEPGKGSTFRVLFPAATGAASAAAASQGSGRHASKQPMRRSKTILVIDDEPTVRRTAKSALERSGYDVILAETGLDGIGVFRALDDKISAVLLDLTMPGMDGEEVFVNLKKIRPDVKVLLSSGFNESDVIQQFDGKGLAGFIQKPYTSTALAGKIAEVLKAAGSAASSLSQH